MRRSYRAPLVIFTPKSLLRRPEAMSPPGDLARDRFQPLLEDPLTRVQPDRVRRIVFCSGKVYYDLLAERERRFEDSSPVALVRLEQLYPWPEEQVAEVFERYQHAVDVTWAQEEPANMGAWAFARERLYAELRPKQKLTYAGRRESASTATGSMRIHREEQAALIDSAFARVHLTSPDRARRSSSAEARWLKAT
jgi:2-oxoglutarate dehydrogenase E1 component